MPKIARAEGRDPRFLTVVLRGGLGCWHFGQRSRLQARQNILPQSALGESPSDVTR